MNEINQLPYYGDLCNDLVLFHGYDKTGRVVKRKIGFRLFRVRHLIQRSHDV